MTNTYTFKQQMRFIIQLVCLITLIEAINFVTGRSLNRFGIIPRDWDGLIGIIASPLLHGHFWHYFSNILPLSLFAWLAMYFGKGCFWRTSIWIICVTGLLVWLLGRDAIHIGASGMIYGYFGFLLLAGFYSGRFRLMLLSILVGFFYGGLIFGVLPLRAFVSWESHLFGFIAGLSAAYLFVDKKHKR